MGDIDTQRSAVFHEVEILELDQVTACFACANQTVPGPGMNADGDIIGLSPGDSGNPVHWSHA